MLLPQAAASKMVAAAAVSRAPRRRPCRCGEGAAWHAHVRLALPVWQPRGRCVKELGPCVVGAWLELLLGLTVAIAGSMEAVRWIESVPAAAT